MQSLWDRGHFREFPRPTAVVSTFPSDTETALTEALHAMQAPGYEHSYYDRSSNSMRGGPFLTITGQDVPYIQKLDYDTNGWFKILSYVAPSWVYHQDLERFTKKFRASSSAVFVAHLATSDALLHIRTAEQMQPFLLDFEKTIARIYADAHGELGVILFSDHGNTETLTQLVDVESFLAGRGWRVRHSIDGPHDVVIPAYGLVGFAALYCQPQSVNALAEQSRGVQGADLVLTHEPGQNGATVRAAGSSATAQLDWTTDGGCYRYSSTGGDPLELAPVLEQLRANGKLDPQGFAADLDLFAATSSSFYPDAAARIRGWAIDHVRAHADVLISFKAGYDHGAKLLGRIVRLVSTHGGLEKSASLGFAMGTISLEPYTRLGDLLPPSLLDSRDSERRR